MTLACEDCAVSLHLYAQMAQALGAGAADPPPPGFGGAAEGLPSWFDVSGLAQASVAAAAVQLGAIAGIDAPAIVVDRRLCGLWFGMSIRPQGWAMPNAWDPIAGDYQTRDGWIRLHTNAPHHRAAALRVLQTPETREAVTTAVRDWQAETLETAIVDAGGCAAAMRSLEEWADHPQGRAIAGEPLIRWSEPPVLGAHRHDRKAVRPLERIRVLDLTRVLAGPVATRFLAAFGADVLRIDPPHWDEPGVVPEVTVGKRCAGLDLHEAGDRLQFVELLRSADLLVHGYRPGALERLGFGAEERRKVNPRLIEVCLSAYGWSGPWAERRGFDSLVQMSAGIAEAGMRGEGADRPFPLPVQALDQATGCLMAAAAARGLLVRSTTGAVLSARLSLARTALVLASTRSKSKPHAQPAETLDDLAPEIEPTDWGPARRLKFPVGMSGVAIGFALPASRLRSSAATW
jgi:crotonobetainyl-CoA:carnitine CoA-transferase CaiB-like acyl-CoA transferase